MPILSVIHRCVRNRPDLLALNTYLLFFTVQSAGRFLHTSRMRFLLVLQSDGWDTQDGSAHMTGVSRGWLEGWALSYSSCDVSM